MLANSLRLGLFGSPNFENLVIILKVTTLKWPNDSNSLKVSSLFIIPLIDSFPLFVLGAPTLFG